MTSLPIILSWFQTGDFPTEAQFKETFSSFRHKENLIPFNEVKGLTEAFQNTLSAEVYDAFKTDIQQTITTLVKLDASNLDAQNKALWKIALGIQNIATVDGPEQDNTGNVYIKNQVDAFFTVVHEKVDGFGAVITDIRDALHTDDMDLDELQEIVTYIKQNREQIELLQQVLIGITQDDKINLVGDYNIWGAITKQNQFNDVVYNKVNDIEGLVGTGNFRHQEEIRANATITHNLDTYDFVIDAYDTVTMYTLPVKVKRLNHNEISVEFDTPPSNFIKITIRKI
jgi:hypothetical protein